MVKKGWRLPQSPEKQGPYTHGKGLWAVAMYQEHIEIFIHPAREHFWGAPEQHWFNLLWIQSRSFCSLGDLNVFKKLVGTFLNPSLTRFQKLLPDHRYKFIQQRHSFPLLHQSPIWGPGWRLGQTTPPRKEAEGVQWCWWGEIPKAIPKFISNGPYVEKLTQNLTDRSK